MAIKNFFSWLTGDDSSDSWPQGTSELIRPINDADQKANDSIVKSEWFTTTTSKGSGMQSDGFVDSFMADARREMNRMHQELSKNAGGFGRRLPSQMMDSLAPKIDETSSEYRVAIELSGYAQQDIKIEARDNTLLVTAEHRSDREDGGDGRRVSEHFVNRFQRIVRLNGPVDPAGITSTFDNGVLRVTARKK